MNFKNSKEAQGLNLELYYLFFISVFLFLSFSPFIYYQFGFHNDFEIWTYDNKICCSGFSETSHLIRIGRFLQAFLQNIYLSFFSELFHFSVGRGVGILFAAISAYLLSRLARDKGMSPWSSTVFSLSVFLLPSVQVNLSWITNFVPGLLNSVLVIFASAIYLKAQSFVESKKKKFLFLSFFLLLSSLFIYPPTAGFFLIPLLVQILYKGVKSRIERLEAFKMLGFFVLTCVTYYLIHRLIFVPWYNYTYEKSEFYRFEVSGSIWKNFIVFIRDIIPMMLNLWNPAPFNLFAAAVLMVVVFAATFSSYKIIKLQSSEAKANLKWDFILLVVTFFIINGPVISAAGGPPSFYRTWHPGGAAVLLFFFKSIESFSNGKLKIISLSLILIVACDFAFKASSYVGSTLSKQMDYSKEQIEQQFSPQKEHYFIVELRPLKLIYKHPLWGELGFLHILTRGHVGYILKRDFNQALVPKIENVVALQNDNQLFLEPQFLKEILNKDNFTLDKDLIIQKKLFQTPESIQKSSHVNLVGTVTATGESTDYARPFRAVDNIYYSFWETQSPLPILYDFNFFESKKISCYTLHAGVDESPDRMPRSWRFLASLDGTKWDVLDMRLNEQNWTDYSSRKFRLLNSKEYTNYRFEFLETNGSNVLRIYGINLSDDEECKHSIP